MIDKLGVAAVVVAGILAPIQGQAKLPSNIGYKIEARIAGPDGAWDFANIDQKRDRLYIARSDAVMVMDLKSHAVTPALAIARRGHQALPLPGSNQLLETEAETGLARFIDMDTGAVLAEVASGKNPDAAFFDSATGLVVVMNAGDGTVTLIDPATHTVSGKIDVGGSLEFAVPDGKGNAYIHIEDRNAIAVVDLKQRRVVKTIALDGCEGPTGLALVNRGTRLISACANKVAVVTDPVAGKVIGSMEIGGDPDAVLVDEKRQRAFIPCGGEGMLAVIDIRDPSRIRLIGTVTTQVGAKTGAIDARDGRIYLPTATLAAPEPGAKRGKPMPGTFVVLIVAPAKS